VTGKDNRRKEVNYMAAGGFRLGSSPTMSRGQENQRRKV
jgi:hypothetical protein